jgi:hypothetical protein
MKPRFIPGLKLSRILFEEQVRPILSSQYPGLAYATGRLDGGSDVLGFDDVMSRDHDWGARLQLFVPEQTPQALRDEIWQTLSVRLPYEIAGWPTHFGDPDPDDNGTRVAEARQEGPINHRVSIETARDFFQQYLGWNGGDPLKAADWLSFSEQKLLTLSRGPIFMDSIGLAEQRRQLEYYPDPIWHYLLACGWTRIGQEEHLMGRAGYRGDELGSRLIASRLIRDIMRLTFLMERRYAPYPKWFGRAFKQLDLAASLEPHLEQAVSAPNWRHRDSALAAAYGVLAAAHNALGITPPQATEAADFFSRPFQVIWGGRIAEAILADIDDPEIQDIAAQGLIGGLDQWSDSTDLIAKAALRPRIRALIAGEQSE